MAIKPRHKRRFFWTIIGLLALIVIGMLVTPMFINLNSVRPRLETAILNRTGVAVKINGDINFGIFGKTTINARDVTFANGSIKNLAVTIPFSGLFNLGNTKLGGDISVYGAKIHVSEIAAIKNDYNISISNSVIRFMDKDYQIISGKFNHGEFNGTVRTDQHKYDISFLDNRFKIQNKNVQLDITGELFSNGGATGTIEMDTNKINSWFEFSEPKITQTVKLAMNFWWDGKYGFKFSEINANDVHGTIELLNNGGRDISLYGNDIDFDFSFLSHPTKFLTDSKLDLDFYGNLVFEKWAFNHLKINATGTRDQIKINQIVADNISFTGGTIDANGATDIMIETEYDNVKITCLFSGTPTDWKCDNFSYGDIYGQIKMSNGEKLYADISSKKIIEPNELIKYTNKFDVKNATVRFKFPNMGGTFIKSPRQNDTKYDYIYNKSLSWLNPHIKFLPEFMLKESGDLVWQDERLTFVPKSNNWSLVLHDKFFFLTGKDAKSWFDNIDLRSLNNFEYTASGYYNNNGDISDLTIKIANHTFTGTATKNNITLKTDVLVIDSFVNQEYLDRYEEMEFLTNAPVMIPFDINKNLYLSADTLIYNGDAYKNFVYALKPGVQTFSITDKSRGNLLATIIKERSEYDIFIQLNKFVTNGKLLSRDFPLNVMDTSITAEIDLTTNGHIAHDLWFNMNGTMDLTFDGGYILGLGLDDFYSSAQNLTRLNVEDNIATALSGGITKLKTMRVIGKYENGNFSTTEPVRFSMRHVDAIGAFTINDGQMTTKLELSMRGAAPEPVGVGVTILPNNKRTYSTSDIMRNFDPAFMRSFIRNHNKF
ncbi:MAG: hypothetical protein IJR92_01705 [Alphaproteobacteria bacterium]|nr:hypothetical protein [Alphaproteobacteria bacterium]